MAGAAQVGVIETETHQLLYRPNEATPHRPSLATRFWAALRATVGNIATSHADRQYLDGMRPEELQELNLRRTDAWDYTTFR